MDPSPDSSSAEVAGKQCSKNIARILPGFLALLSLVLLGLNLVYFFGRGWEDSFYPTSYATLYFSKERPVIEQWQAVPGGIEAEISWNAPVQGWKVFRNGKLHSENSGKNVFLPVMETAIEWQGYTAVPVPEDLAAPLELQIQFFPESFYRERGENKPDLYVIRTDVPIGDFKQFSITDWTDSFEYVGEKGLEETDRILLEKVGIRESDTTYRKLEKLTAFLRDHLGPGARGRPPPDLRWKNPYRMFKEMEADQAQGFCVQHSQLFIYFANRAGLSARIVQGAPSQGNTFLWGAHTWVEAWVPEEQRWAWVDPSPSIAYARDKNGRVLNTIQLADLRRHDAWDGVTFRTYKHARRSSLEGLEGTMVDATYAQVGGPIERQFTLSNIYKWRQPPLVEDIRSDYSMLFKDWTFFWGNLERYYFKPPLAYSHFPTPGEQTYWTRHLLLWSFLASLLATGIAFVRNHARRSPS